MSDTSQHGYPAPGQEYTGTIKTNTKAFGFFTPLFDGEKSDEASDVFIPPDSLHRAFDGDSVRVRVLKNEERGPTGEVVDIIERARSRFIAAIDSSSGKSFAVVDNNRAYADFFIPSRLLGGAEHNDKVVVEFVEWEKNDKNPVGEVVEVLGKKGEHNAEMKAIVARSGFESGFPPEVEAEAEKMREKRGNITEKDLSGRLDYRGADVFTIDPATAKDFDDALSIKRLEDGTYEIGIHIADVSHFVDFGSKLDEEAFERGFSVYLVDRTIPMLPEILSNDLCSLNPNTDKHAFSAILKVDENAHVLERTFTKSVIHSKKRFTYEEAQEILDAGEGTFFENLNLLNSLAKKLSAHNTAGGAIEFETDEVRFELAPDGTPIKVVRKERLDTHKLVEEFMLLANREVASFMSEKNEEKDSPVFVYRVHDLPAVDRIENFAMLTHALGYDLELTEDGSVTSENLSALLEKLDGRPEESLVKTAAIRSMAKATYSDENIGHYGLSFDYYTHFTSPIRRYADLVVHRLLFAQISNEEVPAKEKDFYRACFPHLTEREIAAVDAERSSVKYKHVEYMMNHVGEIFDGTITGVSEWGIYVEDNETKAEGMISLKSLDEKYNLEKESYRLVGETTGRTFRLGDEIRFRVARADLEKKQLDYELVQ